MKKMVITGGSGSLGTYVVEHFIEMGYDVLSVDSVMPKKELTHHMTADLMILGECYGVLAGADAVVHLAAIPAPYRHPNEKVTGRITADAVITKFYGNFIFLLT